MLSLPATELFDALPDALLLVGQDGCIRACNRHVQTLFGYQPAELVGEPVSTLLPPAQRAVHARRMARYWQAPRVRGMGVGLRFVAQRRDGSEFPVDIGLGPLPAPEGVMVLCAVRDVSAHRDLEAKLHRQEVWDQLLLAHLQDVVYIRDATAGPDGARLRTLHGPTERITGHPPAAFLDDPGLWFRLLHPDDVEPLVAHTGRIIQGRTPGERQYRLLHEPAGAYHWIEEKIVPLFGGDGTVSALFGVARDVTDRRLVEEQLAQQVFRDELTGLANRRVFMDRLDQSLARSRRSGRRIAVLFLDIDGFKLVNDSLGHPAGDALLIEIARRLEAHTRAGDTVARFGGDEFAILLDDVDGPAVAAQTADRLQQALQQPAMIDGRSLVTNAATGIVLAGGRRQPSGPEDVLRQADIAMYRAKAAGRGRVAVYDAAMHAQVMDRFDLEIRLRGALASNGLTLHYQPIVELTSGAVTGVEALVRWQDAERGSIPPDQFIPLAEETGLITPLGAWVLAQACHQARVWESLGPAGNRLVISVNLSARQFHQPSLVDDVRAVLARSGLPAGRLQLEITETAAMQDARSALAILARLRALGVRLAIDDFGTGYSSLSYLARLPLDTLKVDRSFTYQLLDGRAATAITRAVVSVAHELGMAVVIEGVETRSQLAAAVALHCDAAQGYLLRRPAPAAELTVLIRRGVLPLPQPEA